MQGRFESKSGEVLAEGRLTEHRRSDPQRLPPTLGAPAVAVPGTPVHWVIPGVGEVAEGTEGGLSTRLWGSCPAAEAGIGQPPHDILARDRPPRSTTSTERLSGRLLRQLGAARTRGSAPTGEHWSRTQEAGEILEQVGRQAGSQHDAHDP
jgi:hypothetical protein